MIEQQLKKLWPTCAICKRSVNKLKWEQDYRTDEILITAYCHGETDQCRLVLNAEWLYFNELKPGYAFVKEEQFVAFDPGTKDSTIVTTVVDGIIKRIE